MVELADTMDLGDVTLVKGFCAIPRRGHSSVEAGTPVFIAAGQALRSASVPSPCKNQRKQKQQQRVLPRVLSGLTELADMIDHFHIQSQCLKAV